MGMAYKVYHFELYMELLQNVANKDKIIKISINEIKIIAKY